MSTFKFGKNSMKHLSSCDPDLQKVALEAIKTSKIDFCIICGHRGEKAQTQAYNSKHSTVQFPNSRHNKFPAMAFDFAPYFSSNPHIHWDDIDTFKKVAKHIKATAKKLEIDIELGIEWETFVDPPHVQLKKATS